MSEFKRAGLVALAMGLMIFLLGDCALARAIF